ncbi:DUF378 domain-containing protein [Candidatus Woesearchaeota archaeon]|nr:DUF378 domain-containing protein [Candidatus Woesearchaeota archaeon]
MAKKGKAKLIDTIVMVLVIVGAINWGLVGLFNLNLVTLIFRLDILARIIYVLVGIAGVMAIKHLRVSSK